MRSPETKILRSPRTLPTLVHDVDQDAAPDAYSRYLLNCSDYLKRQMMVYEHWPQRRYDSLGYKEEKVFADMNS